MSTEHPPGGRPAPQPPQRPTAAPPAWTPDAARAASTQAALNSRAAADRCREARENLHRRRLLAQAARDRLARLEEGSIARLARSAATGSTSKAFDHDADRGATTR
jgi:hypothetical protein